MTNPTDDNPVSAATPARAELFAQASRTLVQQDQALHAVLAQCAADVEVLQQLLWESGLGEAPDPGAQLAAVGEAVLGSLNSTWTDLGPGRTAREAVERFRHALVTTFDESVHAMLTGRLAPLDHLDGVAVAPEEAVSRSRDRLEGRSVDHLVADLRTTASDCAAVADVMIGDGDDAGALRQLWQADVASLEAFLIESAAHAGDRTLATVDLRWELGHLRGLQVPADAADLSAAVEGWRQVMLALVSSAEAEALRASFAPVPAP
jgi:hypothetical protein